MPATKRKRDKHGHFLPGKQKGQTHAMAKTKKKTKPQQIIVRERGGQMHPIVLTAGGLAAKHGAHLAKKGAGLAMQAARDQKHTLTAMAACFALGYALRKGIKLPFIKSIGPAATYGAGAWVAGKYLKNKTLNHSATGLLCVKAYSMGRGGMSAAVEMESYATDETQPAANGVGDGFNWDVNADM